MELKDFDYPLPAGLIAQRPLEQRDASRLMVLRRSTGDISNRGFADILDFLRPGDLLVLNDTRVMASRIAGSKPTGGRVEVLLVERTGSDETWRCLVKPKKGLGKKVLFDHGIEAEVLGHGPEGLVTLAFSGLDGNSLTEKLGVVPLPPYIRRSPDARDLKRYQTVFAEKDGAVAAPTAGLHFTRGLLEEIQGSGVEVLYITLHVGPGTFLPVRTQMVEQHRLLPESYTISPGVFKKIRNAKKENRRVVAVGTTATRALEAAAESGFEAPKLSGRTGIFIYPGFEFKVVDALLTNFHLPCSTLIMLVCAFAGRDNIMKAYQEAVKEKYRFFSYGDAMFII